MILLIIAIICFWYIIKAWLLIEPPVKKTPALKDYKLKYELPPRRK